MSLLDNMMEDFCFVEKTKVEDGAGGFITTWKDGTTFRGVLTLDTTLEAKVAEKSGVSSVYTVTTRKATNLEYNDVIRRLSDRRTFRVTSDGGEVKPPSMAGLDMSQVSCEKWELTR